MESIIVGVDGYGIDLYNKIREHFKVKWVRDDSYPNTAFEVAQRVAKGEGKGILICRTGFGMCVCANKVKGAYAVVCTTITDVIDAVERNGCNVLCLGADKIWEEKYLFGMIALFLTLTPKSENIKTVMEKEEEYYGNV